MSDLNSQVIFLTHSTATFGRKAAEELIRRGHRVYLAADSSHDLRGLEDLGGHFLELSFTDERQVELAVNTILRDEGRIDVLLNDATIARSALVEGFDLKLAHDYFEKQFWGPVRVLKLALPQMRRQGGGRIINARSISAEIPLPLGGWYSAAEQALQSVLRALRLETRQFGISVSTIEVGQIFERAEFIENTTHLPPEEMGDYSSLLKEVWKDREARTRDDCGSLNSETDAILDAVEGPTPLNRYVVRGSAQLMLEARNSLSEEDFDLLILSQFGL